eukprot:scaffold1269_cov242-Chaetoceros_neogracile.AAC.10
MTKAMHFTHYQAWITTLLWTGIVNYFILKHIWSFGGPPASDKRNEGGSSVELSAQPKGWDRLSLFETSTVADTVNDRGDNLKWRIAMTVDDDG